MESVQKMTDAWMPAEQSATQSEGSAASSPKSESKVKRGNRRKKVRKM